MGDGCIDKKYRTSFLTRNKGLFPQVKCILYDAWVRNVMLHDSGIWAFYAEEWREIKWACSSGCAM